MCARKPEPLSLWQVACSRRMDLMGCAEIAEAQAALGSPEGELRLGTDVQPHLNHHRADQHPRRHQLWRAAGPQLPHLQCRLACWDTGCQPPLLLALQMSSIASNLHCRWWHRE